MDLSTLSLAYALVAFAVIMFVLLRRK